MGYGEFKYNAFLSYSRKDEELAKTLERFLEKYTVPRAFRTESRKKITVFRDVYDAHLGDLSDELKKGLDNSEFLIVICSPNSYNSTYVGEEINYFGQQYGKAKILPVLVSGRPNNEINDADPVQDSAFNTALYNFFEEPLAADIRSFGKESFSKKRYRIREARFQIISKLLKTDKTDKLVGRYKWNRRLKVGVPSILILILMVFFGWRYYDKIPKSGIHLTTINTSTEEGKRTINNIDDLEQGLESEIPQKSDKNRLLLATWNIRELGRNFNQNTVRSRTNESLSYIAQIISHFDIIAIQEARSNMAQLDTLINFLGKHWELKFSGVSSGAAGNDERLGFIYDTRKIKFGSMTDEIVVPEGIDAGDGTMVQISRTPYIAEFVFQDTPIQLCNIHIKYPGVDKRKRSYSLKEIDAVANILRKNNSKAEGKLNMILLGDMNIPKVTDSMMTVLENNEFRFPKVVKELPTNVSKTKPYDQIAIAEFEGEIPFNLLSGGVFDFYNYVYKKEDWKTYKWLTIPRNNENETSQTNDQKQKLYRFRKTHQMSDHLIKWIELELKGNLN